MQKIPNSQNDTRSDSESSNNFKTKESGKTIVTESRLSVYITLLKHLKT